MEKIEWATILVNILSKGLPYSEKEKQVSIKKLVDALNEDEANSRK